MLIALLDNIEAVIKRMKVTDLIQNDQIASVSCALPKPPSATVALDVLNVRTWNTRCDP